jgi:glyoxylase-like metal-dependent hydrolase (beta-lactamase superfamily II)
LYGVQLPFVWCYLLVDGDEVVVIDTGMGPAASMVMRWFERTGRRRQLRAILLTHGHLDHAGCAERLRQWSKAEVYLHPADDPIARGDYPYRGITRICGLLETIGRATFASRPPQKLTPLADGQRLPFWGGLEVVHLPGHTPGHVAFYSRKKKILFCGDSILYWGGRCVFPFVLFNVDSRQVRESILGVADLDVEWVYPGHHFGLNRNLIIDVRGYAANVARGQS